MSDEKVETRTAEAAESNPTTFNIEDFRPARGHYVVLRTTGAIERGEFPKGVRLLETVHKLIDCEAIDAVMIDREHEIVILVDDVGVLIDKPINHIATALYHATRRTSNPLVGDAVVCHDRDFE